MKVKIYREVQMNYEIIVDVETVEEAITNQGHGDYEEIWNRAADTAYFKENFDYLPIKDKNDE